MDYYTFKEEIIKRLEKLVGENVRVEMGSVPKNNGVVLDSVRFLDGSNLAMEVYLEPFFESGDTVEKAAQEVYGLYRSNRETDVFDTGRILDYQAAKNNIMYKLVNYALNRELLEDVPHIRYLDLAVVFCLRLSFGDGKNGTALIRNSFMKNWGISLRELRQAAETNTPKMLGSCLYSLDEIIRELRPDDAWDILPCEKPSMYVLTNREKLFGAACVLYPGLMERIALEWGTDIIAIPSSVHEMILLPAGEMPDVRGFAEMIREVNGSQLTPDEVLSDHPYIYLLKQGQMSAA